ncbi:pyridoxamine 5'-phosphate oxidase-domain-containing protein [Gymnopilus junonius]|uniref:Pyridoxamine 5'-phosphate oxidase-domain-containing protein n=1 Tax=Gymnopilus junonius TaxID=109634 RepID=A0A9P5NY09_GYMJU|nr:pyridoxamine 5'-phosphate oxidase-domain-containing protein [Gymnopilus junonius]
MTSTADGPRWKAALEKALSQYDQNVVQIATIDTATTTDGTSTSTAIPRVRSHVVRNFLSKPNAPSLLLLISSTDFRMPKVAQLTANPKAEIVWWIEGTKQQFRFAADIYLLPSPTQRALYTEFMERVKAAEDGTAISVFKDDGEEQWESRRVELFRSLGPGMQAGWVRPTSGTPLKGGHEEAMKWPARLAEPNKETMTKEEYEEAKRLWEVALSNFVFFIIDPVEVDFVDLGTTPVDRRFLFKKKKVEGENWVWDEEELVP